MTMGEVIALIKAMGSGGGSSGGGVLVAHADYDDDTVPLDKTWQEIHDADFTVIVLTSTNDPSQKVFEIVTSVRQDDETTFIVYTHDDVTYVSESADGYPVVDNGGGGGLS